MVIRDKLIGILCFLCMTLLFLHSSAFASDDGTASLTNNRLALLVGSPRVMVGDGMALVDESNIDVVATVENGRTLVPVRFVAEKFGAKVDYNAKTREVNITYANNTAVIAIGSNTMLVNGKEITLDVPAEIQNGRTLLPLRRLAEDILNKKVFYDKGLIVIDDNESLLAPYKDNKLVDNLKSLLGTSDKPGYFQMLKPVKGDLTATISTSMGDVKIKLFPTEAPKAVENFVKLAQNGYYDGLIFHRVIKDFMIQGGDPKGNGTGGESIWGTPFADEISGKLIHLRGALSMANRGPNTNGSQFFIVQNSKISEDLKNYMASTKVSPEIMSIYERYGGTPWLDNSYTIFGQVYEGLDVVDRIASVDVDPGTSKPLEDIKIIKIVIATF